MLIVADTHVHLYPTYDLARAFDAAFENLGRLVSEVCPGGQGSEAVVKVVCLTERRDCHLFRDLNTGAITLNPRFSLHHHGDEVIMVSRDGGEELLLLVAGRQIVTRERLEVLALTTDAEIPDGLPIDEVIERIRAVGGIPVLTWAAGKWLFGRGRIVRRVLKSVAKGGLLVGDSSLRPAGWREPSLMRFARKRGMRVVAGTDPLPMVGEEVVIGTYGVAGESDFNWRDPIGSVRSMLLSSPSMRTVGGRGDLKTVWRRLAELRRNKKKTEPSTGVVAAMSGSARSAQCA